MYIYIAVHPIKRSVLLTSQAQADLTSAELFTTFLHCTIGLREPYCLHPGAPWTDA